jgi:hypothetical protein
MTTLDEIEHAVGTLRKAQKYELFHFLARQLDATAVQDAGVRPMIHGLDTGFLIAFEVQAHPYYPPPLRKKFREVDGEGNSVELNFLKEM